jgi:hypothetical protein
VLVWRKEERLCWYGGKKKEIRVRRKAGRARFYTAENSAQPLDQTDGQD